MSNLGKYTQYDKIFRASYFSTIVFCSLPDRLSLEIVVISQTETGNKKVISKLMVKGFIQEFAHRIVEN